MSGFIRKTEVVANKELVIELYGEEIYKACLEASEGTTFLEIVTKYRGI